MNFTARYLFRFKIVLFMLIFTCCILQAQAQSTPVTIRGKVTESGSGEPLQGVTVQLLNSSTGTSTLPDGTFSLVVTNTEAGTIRFTYVGFETRDQPWKAGLNEAIQLTMTASTKQLDQVMITAGRANQEVKRLTVSTEIIKPYLIENKGTVNMEKLMDQIPGVNVIDGQVNIRGGSGWTFGTGSRVLVMLDDMPYLSGDAGQVAWKFLPTENVEQVEVIKGASSVLYGSSALNGTINIRTARPGSKPVTGATLISGFYDQIPRDSSRWNSKTMWQTGTSAFHSRRINRLDLSIALNYLNDQGYRWGEDDKRGRLTVHTNYHSKKIAGLEYGINASLHDQRSSSFLLWDNFPQGAYIALDSQSTKAHVTNVSIDPHADFYTFGIRHRVRVRYLGITNDITSADTSQDQDNASYTLFGDYQLKKEMYRQLLTVTGGVMTSYTESNAPLYGGLHTQQNLAPYLQLDIKWKRVSAVLGARNESFRLDKAKDNRNIYRAGLNVEITPSTFFRTSYGEGYRYPSIAERYITTKTGSLNIFPNPELKPETGWNAEAGIKQGFKIKNWNGFADLAYFHTEYKDMVEFNFGFWKTFNMFDPLSSLGFKSFNVGHTRIKGWDFSLNAAGAIGKVTLKMIAGYTILDAKSLDPQKVFTSDSLGNAYTYNFTSTDTSRNDLKYRYDQLGKFDVEAGYRIFSIGISMRYNSYMKNIDRVFVSAPFNLFTPGIDRGRELNRNGDYIWDLRFTTQATKLCKVSLIVNNVTNHEMMTRPADMRPPRMFLLQVAVKI